MKSNISSNNKYVLITITFLFLLGRYIVSFDRQFLGIMESIKIFLFAINLVYIPYLLLNIKWKNFSTIYLLIFYCLYFIYTGPAEFSFSVCLVNTFIIFLSEGKVKYQTNVNLIIYAGVLCCILFFLLFFSLKLKISFLEIGGLNYITGVFFIFTLFSILKQTHWVTLLGLTSLLALKSRTSLIALIVLLFLKYYKKKNFYYISIPSLLFFQLFYGFENIFNKWENSNNISSGRIDNWVAFLGKIYHGLPGSLFPYWFIDFFRTQTDVYHVDIVNSASSPHNIYIDLLLRQGILFGSLTISLLSLPIFYLEKNLRDVYIAMLIFGFFEPSITFGTSIISLAFFSVNYIGLKKMNYNVKNFQHNQYKFE